MNGIDKEALDRWITKEPDDYFTPYVEAVLDNLTDDFYRKAETWIDEPEGPGQFSTWLDMSLTKGVQPARAAAIIERAYFWYGLNFVEVDITTKDSKDKEVIKMQRNKI